jgi:hypothetical protein
VSVIQRSDGFGFAIEPRTELRIMCEGGRQHLDRDRAMQPRVIRAIDLTHAPGADHRLESVRPECSTAQVLIGER